MTTTPGSTSPNAWATGGSAFAGVLMTVSGVFSVFEGIAALANDEVYLPVGDYTFKFDLTAWGWIHLILGIIVFAVGVAILKGAHWGRVAGVVLASISVILHFLWLPYQPLWALIAIALGVFIIWALCTDREPVRHI
ncbi:hypothetical protein EF912_09910 [Streptomyces sp. WAC07061]|uniref:DUF7144 family membrane protein n=1 Tax=Streptomyces sp. WAC07061 TaxID=2487410 RepID=UPI000F7AE56B|nr:hypothetical protein [Streptomyces sp. WAC07061]RSS60489.1 hypothetical protein EF912_09910 [Streptomyces sp. WAC07061]